MLAAGNRDNLPVPCPLAGLEKLVALAKQDGAGAGEGAFVGRSAPWAVQTIDPSSPTVNNSLRIRSPLSQIR